MVRLARFERATARFVVVYFDFLKPFKLNNLTYASCPIDALLP